MKKIEAIVRRVKLAEMIQAFWDIGINDVFVSVVIGGDRSEGQEEIYWLTDNGDDVFTSELKIEVVVSDGLLADAVIAVVRAYQNGKVGGDKVIVSDVSKMPGIST